MPIIPLQPVKRRTEDDFYKLDYQLQKMLNLMRPKYLQWVNLHLQALQFTTLARPHLAS